MKKLFLSAFFASGWLLSGCSMTESERNAMEVKIIRVQNQRLELLLEKNRELSNECMKTLNVLMANERKGHR